MEWELIPEEIDKLWVQYEKENPDQGGLDTWDRRLIQAEAKKLIGWIRDRGIAGSPQVRVSMDDGDLWLSKEDWQKLLKETSK